MPDRSTDSKTILVVEDQAAVRHVVARALREAGFEVLEDANGVDALTVVERGPTIDVVVTDITMPHLGGVRFAERLSLAGQPAIVLFITGGDHDPALLPGPLLMKPFGPEALVEEVRLLLTQALRTSRDETA
jgi:two-component system cell cycle sensor histidine kinase/response regulator CckA